MTSTLPALRCRFVDMLELKENSRLQGARCTLSARTRNGQCYLREGEFTLCMRRTKEPF